MGPQPRWAHTITFDPKGRLTLFGGWAGAGADTRPLGDTWEHLGDQTAVPPAGNLQIVGIDPPEARLDAPGDQITVHYTVENAPPQGDVIHVQFLTPDGSLPSAGLTYSDGIALPPGSSSGDLTIVRGTEPVVPGQYRYVLVLGSTPGGFQSGLERSCSSMWVEDLMGAAANVGLRCSIF
jgi:hypothetical protein